MLKITTEDMHIYLTREDSATIEFSAKEGTETYLAETGDRLTFAVSKKYGGDKSFSITNEFDNCFNDASPTQTEFNADKTSYFTKSGNVYTRCTSDSTWSSSTDYYTNEMWNIEILPKHTEDMKFADYYWDVQLDQKISEGKYDTFTIIGKTDSLEPRLTIWGEIA